MKQQSLSRRQMLGLGVAASALVGALTCGGMTTLGLLWLRSQRRGRPATNEAAFIGEAHTVTPTPAPPEMVSREGWGALEPNHDARTEGGFYSEENPNGWRVYEGDLADMYRTVVIHHTAFYEGTDLRTLAEVQRLHREDRGWADVAYHYFVGRSGLLYEGRALNVRGSHVGGYNTGSLGVCLLGNFMEQEPTDAQILSAQRLLVWAAKALALTHIAGHQDFNPETECPGTNLIPYITQFAAVTQLQVGTDGYIPPEDAAAACACGGTHA
ncbi:MAG: N-acetylmuramoyl-L-alanine amidase [Anaerolineae bacterium]|nr:N-acetylmuramoyl-L-alanine amidase [Anaerolineae bacterium]